MLPRSLAIALAATLTACGGGSGLPVADLPPLLPQTALDARQAPFVDLDGSLHIGADVAAPAGRLPFVASHGDTGVAHGTIRRRRRRFGDGCLSPGGLFVTREPGRGRWHRCPGPPRRPGPSVCGDAADRSRRGRHACRVDRRDGSRDPGDQCGLASRWQLRFDAEALPAGTPAPADGEILVTFAAQADWPSEAVPPVDEGIGLAEPRYGIAPTGDPAVPWSIEIVAGRVWVDRSQTGGQERLGVIAHELIHLLGRNHVDPGRFPRTLMVAGGSEELSEHILHPLDREALLAVYGRLGSATSPDRIAEDLGPWSDISMHVRGRLAAKAEKSHSAPRCVTACHSPGRSGRRRIPISEDNTALSGNVHWSGRLLGLTPRAEPVAGAAALTVDLPSLSGSLNFSGLEHWSANAAPGAAGSGAAWRDRHLSYRIAVRGNTFVRTGGDAGMVTGAFFGPGHEAWGVFSFAMTWAPDSAASAEDGARRFFAPIPKPNALLDPTGRPMARYPECRDTPAEAGRTCGLRLSGPRGPTPDNGLLALLKWA